MRPARLAANIAEGCGRDGDPELKRFLQIAMGSASELDYHLVLAHDLKFLDDAVYRELAAGVSEVKRMLAAFIVRLRDSKQRRAATRTGHGGSAAPR